MKARDVPWQRQRWLHAIDINLLTRDISERDDLETRVVLSDLQQPLLASAAWREGVEVLLLCQRGGKKVQKI
jgi:hypothetical protein